MENHSLDDMRHSCSHLLAAAIAKLYPETKLGIGPVIENGFYYDFKFEKPLVEDDFSKIEKEMEEIKKKNLPIERIEYSPEDAKEIEKDQPFKLELINDLAKEGHKTVSFYKMGDFVDLCEGGHVDNTSDIGFFKLLSIAGAYWKGSEKNPMLKRIYGTCFPSHEELDKFLWQAEEAKKRDHRKLGNQLGLWTFSELVGTGLPLFTQKGTLVRRLINEFVENLQSKQGIAQVWTPQVAKSELFKISGHYDKYKESMFQVHSHYSKDEFFLKPMNCPQHTQIYASQPRSYKDLPIRMADFAMLYRDEKPGELMGLFRTRSFSQDDCHIFCREDQVVDEMNKALDMTKEVMNAYRFTYKYRLSLRDPKHPEKYLGDEKTWDKAEKLSEKVIKDRDIDYYVGVGEAAFYAPKLDLIAIDSIGRQWQLSTLQIDFVMPERFKLTYVDTDGKLKHPVMLHRAISGSPERLMAILLEHYAGALPLWLSPIQVEIIPISEKNNNFAAKVNKILIENGIRSEANIENETMQGKIRNATLQKIPYMCIIGNKEEELSKQNNKEYVSVRTREGEDLGKIYISDFLVKIKEEIDKKI